MSLQSKFAPSFESGRVIEGFVLDQLDLLEKVFKAGDNSVRKKR